jgi:hypothetical protein
MGREQGLDPVEGQCEGLPRLLDSIAESHEKGEPSRPSDARREDTRAAGDRGFPEACPRKRLQIGQQVTLGQRRALKVERRRPSERTTKECRFSTSPRAGDGDQRRPGTAKEFIEPRELPRAAEEFLSAGGFFGPSPLTTTHAHAQEVKGFE